MKKWLQLTAMVFLTVSLGVNAQNLVNDGDFEEGDFSVAWNSWGAIQMEQTDTFSGSYSLRM